MVLACAAGAVTVNSSGFCGFSRGLPASNNPQCVTEVATDCFWAACPPCWCCRLQIVQVADKVYGVSHTNKVSNVDPISKEYALEFLQAEEEQEQQRREGQQQRQRQGRTAAPVAAG